MSCDQFLLAPEPIIPLRREQTVEKYEAAALRRQAIVAWIQAMAT